MTRRARRRALLLGAAAEWIALAALVLRGYRPLARRWRAPGGEVDLVVRRGRLVCFVEVKARADLAAAADALSARKRRRIARAARAWIARNPWTAAGWSFRMDAVLVAPGRWPVHVEGVGEVL